MNTTFTIKSYPKSELARCYFPDYFFFAFIVSFRTHLIATYASGIATFVPLYWLKRDAPAL